MKTGRLVVGIPPRIAPAEHVCKAKDRKFHVKRYHDENSPWVLEDFENGGTVRYCPDCGEELPE